MVSEGFGAAMSRTRSTDVAEGIVLGQVDQEHQLVACARSAAHGHQTAMCVSAVRWSSKPTGRSAFHLARGRGTLFIADAHYFCLDEVTPGARLVQVDQHLPTVVVAYAGYVGRVSLQGRNKLSGMIELVEHVIARCRVCAQTAYGASFLELGVKVSQIRNRYA